STSVTVSVAANVCACVSGPLSVKGKSCGSIAPEDELCACVGALAGVVAKSALAPIKVALSLASEADVVASLTAMISATAEGERKKTCSFPAHAVSSCSPENICGFSCLSGFKLANGVCVAVDADVGTAVSLAGNVCGCISGPVSVRGNDCGSIPPAQELCTCVSSLSGLVAVSTLAPIQAARSFAADVEIVASLTAMIAAAHESDRQTCTFPAHATPSCSRENLCGFTCLPGHKLHAGLCVDGGLLGLGFGLGFGISL
ncbi:unnamed protein product, partial [Mycena citricolor]